MCKTKITEHPKGSFFLCFVMIELCAVSSFEIEVDKYYNS